MLFPPVRVHLRSDDGTVHKFAFVSFYVLMCLLKVKLA